MVVEAVHDLDLALEELVRSGGIETYFAPVVDAYTFDKVGYQILQAPIDDPALGHAESENLRREMHASAMIGDIDASLRATALRTAEAAGLPKSNRLFLHAEGESFATLEDRTEEPDRSVILQLDASRVSSSPASVLRAVRQARSMGWGVGMSSVGADLRSTSFVPLVNPSVVGLHPDVLRIDCESHLAELNRLLHAHLERTGAGSLQKGSPPRMISTGCELWAHASCQDRTSAPRPRNPNHSQNRSRTVWSITIRVTFRHWALPIRSPRVCGVNLW